LKTTQYPNATFSWNVYTRIGDMSTIYNRHGALPVPLPASVPGDSLASPIADYAYSFNNDGKGTQAVRSGGNLATETTNDAYDTAGRLSTVRLPDGTQRLYTY